MIVLKESLDRFEAREKLRPPEERREVPNLSDLARAAGVSRAMMSKIANNEIKLLNLETMQLVIADLRRRGFEADVSDVVAYYPNERGERNGQG